MLLGDSAMNLKNPTANMDSTPTLPKAAKKLTNIDRVRVSMGPSRPEKTASKMTLVGLCFGAAVLIWIVSGLPE
jgi:hypothetical protein